MRLAPLARPWQVRWANRLIPQYGDPGLVYDDLLRGNYQDAAVWIDAGCGRNYDILMAGDFRGRGIGFDLAPVDLPHYLRASIYRVPFRPASVDLISCRWVVEHLDDPAAALAELHGALAPGKHLLIRTTNGWHYTSLLSRVLPMPLKRKLIPSEIFPTRYRLNSKRAIAMYLRHHPEWRLRRVVYIENLHYGNPLGFMFSVLTEWWLSLTGAEWLKSTIIFELAKF